MRKIKFISCLVLIMTLMAIYSCNVFVVSAEDADPISAMQGMANGGTVDGTISGKLGPIINTAIGLIQMVGTGLSLVMVTILGIKYIMSAPSDKADVKKQITPMLIGCVVLFASVNLVQIIANFTISTFSAAG